MKIKALTIKQPWAWAIASGHKLVENRTWRTPYRGPLAIHAGKTWDKDSAVAAFRSICVWTLSTDPLACTPQEFHRLGAVIAVADLVGICNGSTGSRFVQCECGPWAMPGQFHWQLRNVRRLPEPFRASGQQQLWTVDLPDFPIGGAR